MKDGGGNAGRVAARQLAAAASALFMVGFVARVWPFFDGALRFLERFPTEDGYFMLSIGRNLALGKGFTTADGTIATNGTQPLTTFLWGLLFWLTGGDRAGGVALVLLFEIAISALAARALYRFGSHLLAGRSYAHAVSLLAAALWFASPLTLPHTMNCLETGTYGLCVIWCAHAFVKLCELPSERFETSHVLRFGALLGLTFWARNDAVFLITASCVCYLAPSLRERTSLRLRFTRTLAFGAVSVVIALPWLLYNYVGFGSIMPISGRAERLTGSTGDNVYTALTTLAEYTTLVLPIPQSLQDSLGFAALAALVLIGEAVLLGRLYQRANAAQRTLILCVVWFGTMLSIYYGVFFGAKWFVQRYLFPLSPFFALLFVLLLYGARDWSKSAHRETALSLVTSLLIAICIAANTRNQILNRDHPHFQVVRWVQKHVPEHEWIGGIQTGTLGFFHDRTLNFDGKVNPSAYQAAIEQRRPAYVASTRVQYLVDWIGIVTWLRNPPIHENFEVVVSDLPNNLGVLMRREREVAHHP
ncbi:MAG TPA: hypothetical protein VJR89_06530 [Polyangiales bacterium]|nr:hypothetical protein [Polyangiales bacterium]